MVHNSHRQNMELQSEKRKKKKTFQKMKICCNIFIWILNKLQISPFLMWGQDTSISYLSNDFETKIKETNPKLQHVSTIIIKALSHLSRVTSVNFLFLLILFKAMFSVTRRQSNMSSYKSTQVQILEPQVLIIGSRTRP